MIEAEREFSNKSKVKDNLRIFISRINEGSVIPIIGNSVRNEHIFDVDGDQKLGLTKKPVENLRGVTDLTVDEALTAAWAKSIDYPYDSLDKYRLSRVAVYNRWVKSSDDKEAKTNYLDFLKNYLLYLAAEDKAVAHLIEDLQAQVDTLSFSHIVRELGYPKPKPGQQDSLRLLAKLPLPIYVTTSYYEFIEQALRAEHKRPHTDICYWSSSRPNPRALSKYPRNPDFKPTEEEPLVFHLLGFEEFPETLVLSEDDYLDFLMNISKDMDRYNQIIPLYLQQALCESSLILLGYRLQDWDFRVLFRGVIKHNLLRPQSLTIQLDPKDQHGITDPAEAWRYLQQYFNPNQFDVIPSNTDKFVNELWQRWDKWRQNHA